MAGRKRTAILYTTLCLLHIVSGAATPADGQKGAVADTLGQQDKVFKMSPQDKAFGSNKFDEPDKFNAPKKAPVSDDVNPEKDVSKDKSGKAEDPAIIDDYDPNRLGVSAEDAAGDSADRKKPQQDKDSSAESTPDKSNPKSGLSTGKGANSGGVGAAVAAGAAAAGSVDNEPVVPGDEMVAAIKEQIAEQYDSENGEIGSSGHFIMSFTMIVMSEIGDKTFLVAALMGMRHNPWFVYSASFAALAIMTVLSAILGTILPTLLSKKFTTLLASVLFIVFGANLLREAMTMDANGHVEEEMHEVEHEIELHEQSNAQSDLEKGGADNAASASTGKLRQATEGISNLAGLVFSPLWVQIFLMTFLGEWGDRSQIATIALSAGGHFEDVCAGALAGHALCTLGAVFAGYFVATHLSMRTVTLAGAVGFFIFGMAYLYEGLYAQ